MMTPQEFVSGIRQFVIDENLATYRDFLDEKVTARGSGDGQPWLRVIKLYQRLEDEERVALVAVLREVMVETVSSLVSVLDGVSALGWHREQFRLTYGDDNTKLNGDLLDYLWAAEQSTTSPG